MRKMIVRHSVLFDNYRIDGDKLVEEVELLNKIARYIFLFLEPERSFLDALEKMFNVYKRKLSRQLQATTWSYVINIEKSFSFHFRDREINIPENTNFLLDRENKMQRNSLFPLDREVKMPRNEIFGQKTAKLK